MEPLTDQQREAITEEKQRLVNDNAIRMQQMNQMGSGVSSMEIKLICLLTAFERLMGPDEWLMVELETEQKLSVLFEGAQSAITRQKLLS